VALIGLPGTGKSTVARHLAKRLGCEAFDTDAAVEALTAEGIPDFVQRRGWAAFRAHEQRVLHEALERDRVVIATGGGVVESARLADRLAAAATVVWLYAPASILLDRLAADAQPRPLLASEPERRLAELARRREPLYARIADLTLDTAGSDPATLARRIAAEIGAAAP